MWNWPFIITYGNFDDAKKNGYILTENIVGFTPEAKLVSSKRLIQEHLEP